MTTLISFDSQSLMILLDEKHKEYFNTDDPIFYRIKNNGMIPNKNKRNISAIDIALQNNQIIALNLITNYIATY